MLLPTACAWLLLAQVCVGQLLCGDGEISIDLGDGEILGGGIRCPSPSPNSCPVPAPCPPPPPPAPPPPPGCLVEGSQASVLPGRNCAPAAGNVTGTVASAQFLISFPQTWNQVLVMFVPGFIISEDIKPPFESLNSNIPFIVPRLTERGYAVMSSSMLRARWNVETGIPDIAYLTEYFATTYCRPNMTILAGVSLGGLIALNSAEKLPHLYDGTIAFCSPAAGTRRNVDLMLDFQRAYDTVKVFPWGSPNNLRRDVDLSEVLPLLIANTAAAQVSNEQKAETEFIRLLANASEPLWLNTSSRATLADSTFFALSGLALVGFSDLQWQAGGGRIGQNEGRHYSLDQSAIDYLKSLGGEPEEWLATMNDRHFTANPDARSFVARQDLNGRVFGPVLTLHNTEDQIVTSRNMAQYRDLLNRSGRAALLRQAYVPGQHHCSFTLDQALIAVDEMHRWLSTGVAPLDTSFNVSFGFVEGFNPPPWPYQPPDAP